MMPVIDDENTTMSSKVFEISRVGEKSLTGSDGWGGLGEPAVTQAGMMTRVCRGKSQSYTAAENQHMEGLRLNEHCFQGSSSEEKAKEKTVQRGPCDLFGLVILFAGLCESIGHGFPSSGTSSTAQGQGFRVPFTNDTHSN